MVLRDCWAWGRGSLPLSVPELSMLESEKKEEGTSSQLSVQCCVSPSRKQLACYFDGSIDHTHPRAFSSSSSSLQSLSMLESQSEPCYVTLPNSVPSIQSQSFARHYSSHWHHAQRRRRKKSTASNGGYGLSLSSASSNGVASFSLCTRT